MTQTFTDIASLDEIGPLTVALPDETVTAQLGAWLAPRLRAGDVVYLRGDLGAGKSSLARGLIRALTNPDQDVPSPTFTLLQTYETPGFSLHHLDLYRIENPDEIHELGLDDAREAGVLVIEWPDKLRHLGFDDRLDIVIEQAPMREGRVAHIAPVGNFRDTPPK